jgi:hypothetical protein
LIDTLRLFRTLPEDETKTPSGLLTPEEVIQSANEAGKEKVCLKEKIGLRESQPLNFC